MKKIIFIVMAAAIFCMVGYADTSNPLNKWKIGNNYVNSSTFELREGQSATYDGDINRGNFRNFGFKARITHSERAKASFWIHSDANLSKGYSILIGNSVDDHRRSGSLTSVRNLYRPVASSSFDLEVRVEGKRIIVMIDGVTVVDYLEPAVPYRTEAHATQLLSDGQIGFRVENGTLNVANADITLLANNLPNYPDGMEPTDERDDAVIRLQQQNFPIVDYHVHPPRGMDMETLFAKSLTDGFEYGIAVHGGVGSQISSDENAKEYMETNRNLPFFLAMQAEGREWVETCSKESREMFDYVFTDALTFTDHKGRRARLGGYNDFIIDIPEQEYMDMFMDRMIQILNEEPIDIWVNPTLLPTPMMEEYDKYWTDRRVAQIVKALKDNNIALEINARYKIPNARIIQAAKVAGVKFALGTNNRTFQDLDRLDYSTRMVEECGLTIADMWFPKIRATAQ